MLKAIHCDAQLCRFVPLEGIEHVDALIADHSQQIWLDLIDPTHEELARVGEELHLHPLAIEDATTEHQRPKIEQYDDFFFMVFYTASFDTTKQRILTHELNLFVGKNYLLTVHYTPMPELEEAERRWKRNSTHLSLGSGTLLYAMLDTIVDNYFPVVELLVEQSEDLEDLVYEDKTPTRNVAFQILGIKKMFLQMRRLVNPERDILNVLTNRDNPLFSEEILVYFRDVSDHITRLADTVDTYRDQVNSLMDANLAVASNNMNQVMRTLTATSIILMSAGLIAGIYGMNFDSEKSPFNMPELHWMYGYIFALGLMVVSAVVLFIYFKRRQWF